MNLSGTRTMSLLDSVLNVETTRQDIGVAVLIKMLETSALPALLDVYA
jgi:hypothetical protein